MQSSLVACEVDSLLSEGSLKAMEMGACPAVRTRQSSRHSNQDGQSEGINHQVSLAASKASTYMHGKQESGK